MTASSVIAVHADDATLDRLLQIARETGRRVDELAEAAVAEAALNYFRDRPPADDPARRGR